LPIADFQLAIGNRQLATLTLPDLVLHEQGLSPSFGWLFMMLMPFGMA
jgi:hypothetical protein